MKTGRREARTLASPAMIERDLRLMQHGSVQTTTQQQKMGMMVKTEVKVHVKVLTLLNAANKVLGGKFSLV